MPGIFFLIKLKNLGAIHPAGYASSFDLKEFTHVPRVERCVEMQKLFDELLSSVSFDSV